MSDTLIICLCTFASMLIMLASLFFTIRYNIKTREKEVKAETTEQVKQCTRHEERIENLERQLKDELGKSIKEIKELIADLFVKLNEHINYHLNLK
jgi:hypothetical protein